MTVKLVSNTCTAHSICSIADTAGGFEQFEYGFIYLNVWTTTFKHYTEGYHR